MSNTTEYYANKANLTPVINKIEGKLNNRYTKEEVDDLLEEHSGGHTIKNASGTALTQRDMLQFKGGLSASDDSTNAVTVVDDTVPEIQWSVWNAMTPQEQEAIPNAIILNAPDSGGGDTSACANKTDISSIILTGTTNTSGNTITAGTWFYLNGEVVKAKVDIASNATFTLNTNYEKKSIGAELAELNSNIGGSSPLSISSRGVTNTTNFETTGHTYGALADAVKAKWGTDARTFKFGEAYEISQYPGAPQGAVVLYNVFNYNYQEVWVFYINRIYVRFQYANPEYSVVEYSLLG